LLLNDPYDILGLSPSASATEIKAAYRKLARERHPDRDPGNPWAEDEFKELSQAYAILSDPKTRTKFDSGEIDGTGTIRPRRRAKSGPTKTRGRGPKIKIHGTDVEYALSVPFLEAAQGCVKHVSMTNGKRLKVSIPAGTEDGAMLRLKGQGMPGIGGGKNGDAHVQINIGADPRFRREETDIHLELAISLPEAVLGAKIDAPTIDGTVSITVPAGSNTGTILRLKGKGLPTGPKAGGPRGDQYVTLKVLLPKKTNKELNDFVIAWAERNSYEVRPKPSKT